MKRTVFLSLISMLFWASGSFASEVTFTVSPDQVHPGQEITVSWACAGFETHNMDWIGMYIAGTANSKYLDYKYTYAETSGTMAFRAPEVDEPTDIEFRYLMRDGFELAGSSDTIKVLPWPELQVSLSASPQNVEPRAAITVDWNVLQGRTRSSDWIGVYETGAENRQYLNYQYTGGAEQGSITFSAPSTPCEIEFRYLLDNGYEDIATSNTVIVGTGIHTLSIDIDPQAGGYVDVDPDNPTYAGGEDVVLTAEPADGYEFSHWSGDIDSYDNPVDITMDGDICLTAHFDAITRTLDVSSATGGRVVEPGEGSFSYDDGTVVTITAVAHPSCTFLAWEGSAVDAGSVADPQQPVTEVTMDDDYDLRAKFATLFQTLYVDDDAVEDPGPNTPALSDPNEDGSLAHPFDEIAEAIEVAIDGVTVRVREGTYHEILDFHGKSIVVRSWQPEDLLAVSQTVIDGNGVDTVVTFAGGEDANSVLSGFVITGGCGYSAGAIACDNSSPIIENCLIVGNRILGDSGGAVTLRNSNSMINSCTIADNLCGVTGAGVYWEEGDAVVSNSIVWNNSPAQIVSISGGGPLVVYSDVQGGWSGWKNISFDPLFVMPGTWSEGADSEAADVVWIPGDYHLLSQAGRWVPLDLGWIIDDVTSPCIDKGDPEAPVGAEPVPNGNRINMGAYGGTPEAGKSP